MYYIMQMVERKNEKDACEIREEREGVIRERVAGSTLVNLL